jgi:hypothetical protein
MIKPNLSVDIGVVPHRGGSPQNPKVSLGAALHLALWAL